MNKYIRSTLIFAGVWFAASLLNGLLSGISIMLLENNSSNEPGLFPLAVILSFAFSVPVVGLVWFIVLMAQLANKNGNDLLQFTLRTALFCAIVAALVFVYTLGTEFMNARFVVALSIIISALASVLIFRKQIKTNE